MFRKSLSMLPLLALPFLSCTQQEELDGVNILVVLPMSGNAASGAGEQHLHGIEMALETLDNGGAREALGGARFVLTPINSGNGADAVEAAIDAVIADHEARGLRPIRAVLSTTAAAYRGAARAAIRNQIPHLEISNGAHDEEFLYCSEFTDPDTCIDYSEDDKRYLFGARPLCRPEAEVTADFIAAQFPEAKVALFRGDDVHDRMHTTVIRERLAELDFQGTVIESGDAANDNDFIVSYDVASYADVIADAVDAHQPDVIFWHLDAFEPNYRFVRDLRLYNGGAGWQGDSVTCGMERNERFIDNTLNEGSSPYLAGLRDDGQPRDGRFYFVMRSPIPGDRLQSFTEAYEQRYQRPPHTYSSSAYDAAMLVGLGILRAGVDASNEAVRDAMIDVSRDGDVVDISTPPAELVAAAISGGAIDYEGVSGPMDWQESRQVAGSFYVEQVIERDDGSYWYEELANPPRETR